MKEKKIKLWATHDKGDSAHTVWLHSEKPTMNAANDGFWSSLKDKRGCVDESFIPELTFENSPKEIEITILEKTLGEVDGYQSDDGILEHKCAITAVRDLAKKQRKQKPVE